jgi:hypothetical protein
MGSPNALDQQAEDEKSSKSNLDSFRARSTRTTTVSDLPFYLQRVLFRTIGRHYFLENISANLPIALLSATDECSNSLTFR